MNDRVGSSLGVRYWSLLLELEDCCWYIGVLVASGGGELALVSFERTRSRRRMLKIECFRVCACGSVPIRDVGEDDEGEMRSVDLVGARPGAPVLESIGASIVLVAAASSGFAMRSPPKDCDRLRSFCIAAITMVRAES